MTTYTKAQREVQEQLATTSLADGMEQTIVRPDLDAAAVEFIQSRDFFFLSTVSGAGEPTVSHKGGAVGCVNVLDARTLVFPAYDGNGMQLSLGNIVDTGKIGLLFMDFMTPHRVRVQASAQVLFEGDEMARFPGAIAVVVAQIDRAFVNCARYIHKYERIETSRHVPDATGEQPLAAWKRIDAIHGLLSEQDRQRAASEGQISAEDYAAALARGET